MTRRSSRLQSAVARFEQSPSDWFSPGKCSETIFEDMREPPKKPLHLKGQMKYVPQWDSLIFLGTPM